MDQNSGIDPDPFEERISDWFDSLAGVPAEVWFSALMLAVGFLLGVGAGGYTGFLGWMTFLSGTLLATASAARHQKIGFLRTVAMEDVVDQWGTLIQGAQEQGDMLLEEVARGILDSEAPNVRMERRDVAPSWLRGMLGGRRSFLIVSNGEHPRLKPFRMYINARAYGQNLQMNWYLMQQPGIGETFTKLMLLVPLLNFFALPIVWMSRMNQSPHAGVLELDFFDQQDLNAYVSNAHHCLLAAVDEVVVGLGQDPSRIDRKSRGFFGVS